MASEKLKKTPSMRLPAPALFVGPPSHNTSTTSLLSPNNDTLKPNRTPLTRQRSLLSQEPRRPLPAGSAKSDYDGDLLSATSSNPAAPFHRRQKQTSDIAEAEAASRVEAIWAEMQNTLEEVELSAIKGPGMTVFGAEHTRALDELRRAQIDLAKAWARSEADESDQVQQERQSAKGTDAADMLAADRAETLRPGSVGGASDVGSTLEKTRLEEETERDIELSRKRREANDEYFEKVSKGVLEVVNKLEDVARAMKGVEQESKEIWHDNESSESSSSLTSGTTGA